MRIQKLITLMASGSLFGAIQVSAQLTSPLAVEFLGRDGSAAAVGGVQPACVGINPSDLAGVVPQIGFNALDNQYNGNLNLAVFNPLVPNVGTSVPLLDTNFSPTTVTLSFTANDSWYNDVNNVSGTAITKPNALMMQGIIKSSASGGVPAVFTFNNVPDGEYDLYVLCDMNGDNTIARIWDFYNITTNYIREQHQFYDTNVFIQSTAKTVAEATNVANYVKFGNLGTYGRGQIGVLAQWVSGNDGIGIAGLQLVPTGPLLVNTNPLSLLLEPISRRGAEGTNNVTFTAKLKGPPSYVQWLQNGAAVPGQTNLTYTPDPITAAMNNAQISITASNNLNSVTSSNAILTVGQYITLNGVQVLNGGVITITTQPQPVNTIAGRGGPARFSVAATTSFIGDASGLTAPLYYQWQAAPKGSSTFTAIPGATNATFVTPNLTTADDGTQFKAVLTASDATVTSSAALLTVVPNTIPPAALNATAMKGFSQVGVQFDEAIDPVSASTAANYKVNGVQVLAATLRSNVANEQTSEQNLVSLITAAPITADFTLTVTGLKDTVGNVTTNSTITGKVLGLTLTDVGSTVASFGVDATGNASSGIVAPDPQFPNVVTNWGAGAFDVLAQGNDYWNNADGFGFVWEPKTNSFDVRVQVVSVEGINNWSAGALEVREGPPTTNGGGWELARHYFCKVDYGGPTPTADASGSGANTYEFNCRLAPGNPALRERGGGQGAVPSIGNTNNAGFSYGWGGQGPGNPSPVPFPNAWIRIARVKSVSANGTTNDHLMGYSGTDGTNWSLRQDVNLLDANHAGWLDITGKPAGPLPDVMYVGLASTSHTGFGNGNTTNSVTGEPYQCWVVYRNYGDTPTAVVPTNPTVSVQHNADGTVTLTYTGNLYSSATVNGAYTKVASATSPWKVTPSGSPAATFYRAGP